MYKDLSGRKFGRLLAVEPIKIPGKAGMFWKCKCDCGNDFIAQAKKLNDGRALSCGCLMREHREMFGKQAFTTNRSGRLIHGMSKHPLYRVFHGMKQRCYDKSNIVYKYYGGRGIDICEEWLENPIAFVQWGLSNGWKKGLQIDRIDNDKGYSPENCRFVSPKENLENRRPFVYYSKHNQNKKAGE